MRHRKPKIIRAFQRENREVRRVSGDDLLGELPAPLAVGDLAHLLVEAQLVGGLEGVVIFHQESGCARSVAEIEFDAKVGPQRDELVKHTLVAECPRSETGEEDKSG